MTDLHNAIAAFWGGFSLGGALIPAYMTGRVPSGAALPYITYEVKDGAFFGVTVLTAFVWMRDSEDARAQLAGVLDQIAAAIPEGGRKLCYSGGMAMLFRNVDFQGYYDDPDDTGVLGARVSVEVRFYNH